MSMPHTSQNSRVGWHLGACIPPRRESPKTTTFFSLFSMVIMEPLFLGPCDSCHLICGVCLWAVLSIVSSVVFSPVVPVQRVWKWYLTSICISWTQVILLAYSLIIKCNISLPKNCWTKMMLATVILFTLPACYALFSYPVCLVCKLFGTEAVSDSVLV